MLFVDDDEALAQSISRYFRRDSQIEMEIAFTALEAIRMTERKQFDVIISDWRMPTMNGVELLIILSRRSPHTKLIFATAYPQAERMEKVVREAGVRLVLTKPLDLAELRESLVRMMQLPDGA